MNGKPSHFKPWCLCTQYGLLSILIILVLIGQSFISNHLLSAHDDLMLHKMYALTKKLAHENKNVAPNLSQNPKTLRKMTYEYHALAFESLRHNQKTNLFIFILGFGLVITAAIILLHPTFCFYRQTRTLLEKQKQSLEKAEQNQKFLQKTSHNLRTSLNGILGISNLIDNGGLSSEQREKMVIVRRSSEDMLHIIDQIDTYVNELMGIAQEAEQITKSLSHPTSSAQFNSKILVVEDNKINQLVARKMLQKIGCTVDIANSGSDAIDMYKQFQYDLIFMDCEMPDMDGYATTKHLRNYEKNKNISPCPIIALTANVLEYQKDKIMAAEMDDIVAKPATISDLQNILQNYTPQKLTT